MQYIVSRTVSRESAPRVGGARIIALAAVLIAASACGRFAGPDTDDDGSGATPSGNAPGSSSMSGSMANQPPTPSSSSGAPAPDPNSPACITQQGLLIAAIESTAVGSNAVLGVETPACGQQIVVTGNSAQITQTSLHRIGGVTKTFISAVMLTLVADGKVALTDTVNTYVAQTPNSWSQVTVRELLNHTSGIYNYTDDDEFNAASSKVWTPAEIVSVAASHSTYDGPGRSYHYSNTNYILLGMIAEKVTSQSIASLVRSRALKPANLTSTFFEGEETLSGTLAPGFSDGDNVTTQVDPSTNWASGAIVSSPADLLSWMSMLYGGQKVLTAANLTTLLDSPGTPTGTTGITYGLGVKEYSPAASLALTTCLGHDGNAYGYRAQIAYFQSTQTGIVAIIDNDNGDTTSLLNAAIAVLPLM